MEVQEAPSTSGLATATKSPKKELAKKKKEAVPEVKVDDDGWQVWFLLSIVALKVWRIPFFWQVYDPAQFESTATTSNAIPAVELSDIGEISSAVFQELPANIKAVCFLYLQYVEMLLLG